MPSGGRRSRCGECGQLAEFLLTTYAKVKGGYRRLTLCDSCYTKTLIQGQT